MTLEANIGLYIKSLDLQAEAVTLENYRRRLEQFADYVKCRQVTKALVLEYRRSMVARRLARSSIAMHLSTIRTFYRWLGEHGHVTANPVPRLRADEFEASHERMEGITETEYNLILAAAKRCKHVYWEYGVRLGWNTGFRLRDVSLLRPGSVNISEACLEVVPHKTRKTNPRTLQFPIPHSLVEFLRPKMGGEYLCPEMAKNYLYDGHHTLSAQFCALARSVGVEKGFHKFRDSMITRLICQDVNPALVAEMMRISIERVMTYLKTPLAVKREAILKILPAA